MHDFAVVELADLPATRQLSPPSSVRSTAPSSVGVPAAMPVLRPVKRITPDGQTGAVYIGVQCPPPSVVSSRVVE
ncbi:MAG: hypothetical protein U0841_19370 [Chloroflexia bacterium]